MTEFDMIHDAFRAENALKSVSKPYLQEISVIFEKSNTGLPDRDIHIHKPVQAYKNLMEDWDINKNYQSNRYRVLALGYRNEIIGKIDLHFARLTKDRMPALFETIQDIGATKIVIGEKNSPSQDIYPTQRKINSIIKMKEFGEQDFNVTLLDHLIMRRSHYYSFADNHMSAFKY